MLPLVERAHKLLDVFRHRRRAYQLAFGSPAGREVLEDLATFCRVCKPTYHADPRMDAIVEGRREVFWRIQHHLGLTSEQLVELYGGKRLFMKQTGEYDG